MNVKILKATVRPPQDEETNLLSIAYAAIARAEQWYPGAAERILRNIASKLGYTIAVRDLWEVKQ